MLGFSIEFEFANERENNIFIIELQTKKKVAFRIV